jgi:hypothetical protein
MDVCLMMMAMLGLPTFVEAQETVVTKKTEVIREADGTYTVIEYPVEKEVIVTLTPGTLVTGATGTARVMRSAEGTQIFMDLADIPDATTNFHVYAVDPAGKTNHLGPVKLANGRAKAEFKTPLNQFMLILSPVEGLTAITPASTIAFHSAVPEGYAIIPRQTHTDTTAAAVKGVAMSAYDVPMLGLQNLGSDDREVSINFTGELADLDAKAYLKREDGVTEVKMKFDEMDEVPSGKWFVLWAVAPDGSFTKLGEVYNSTETGDSGEIVGTTTLTDFGLFMTVEDAEVTTPTSRIYSVFRVVQ